VQTLVRCRSGARHLCAVGGRRADLPRPRVCYRDHPRAARRAPDAQRLSRRGERHALQLGAGT